MCVFAGAQAYAIDPTNNFASSSTAFAAAIERYFALSRCLFINATDTDATAADSATAATNALAERNATAASDAVIGALCKSVAASATAYPFGRAGILTSECSDVISQAASSKCNCCVGKQLQVLCYAVHVLCCAVLCCAVTQNRIVSCS